MPIETTTPPRPEDLLALLPSTLRAALAGEFHRRAQAAADLAESTEAALLQDRSAGWRPSTPDDFRLCLVELGNWLVARRLGRDALISVSFRYDGHASVHVGGRDFGRLLAECGDVTIEAESPCDGFPGSKHVRATIDLVEVTAILSDEPACPDPDTAPTCGGAA